MARRGHRRRRDRKRTRGTLERCPECRSASRGRTPQMFCQHRWHDTPAHPRPIESVETVIRIEEHDPKEQG